MPFNSSPRPQGLPPVPLTELAALVQAELREPGVASLSTISGITLRSGDVQPADLFAAVQGGQIHGATVIGCAIEAGAGAVLTDDAGARIAGSITVPMLVVPDPRAVLGLLAARIYGDPSKSLKIIGVTGTSGKTTTSYLIEAGLRACGRRTGVIGTVETRIGDEVLPSVFTTPEAPDLQALLAVMVQHGVQAVAMEVSSHALSMGRVSATGFAIGAFTNLSQDHLDFHGDMESYFRAKELLFDGRALTGVVDVDDAYGYRLARDHPDLVTVSAAGEPDADWQLDSVQTTPSGVQHLRISGPAGQQLTVDLALPGAFNISNALVAIACLDAAGFDPIRSAAAISGVVVPGRMQAVDGGQDYLAIVDYAHKPAALEAVLGAIRGAVTGRIIVVVGAGGDRDKTKREVMGSVSSQNADLVFVTDDNPRSEDPSCIRAEIIAGALTHPDSAGRVHEVGDRRAAIRAAVDAAGPGDAVLIAGKGHEQGQYVGDQVLPFSDVAELLAALRKSTGQDVTGQDVTGQDGADDGQIRQDEVK